MLVLTGKKSKELADVLGMSERTLKFHVGNLTQIFGVSTRAQLQVKVFGDVLSALHQAQGGRSFGTNPDQRILKASRLLSELFEDDDSPLAWAFAEPLKPKDLKPKRKPSKK